MIRIPDGRNLAGPIPVRRRRRKTDPGASSPDASPNLPREAPDPAEVKRPTRPGRKSPRSPRQPARDAASSPELKLIVGVSRKRGVPEFGSIGASCGLEIRVEPPALDTESFETRVREAFEACTRAVDDQLDRSGPSSREPADIPLDDHRPTSGTRPCTPAQVRALHALARRLDLDLDALVLRRFDAPHPRL